ncbi:MAG: sigma 54-interacting transcriptional regulator [Acidobacteriota bacterium]
MRVVKDQSEGPEEMSWAFKGSSEMVRNLLKEAFQAAKGGDKPILITGPVGSGKSHLARYIHHHSPRSQGPLVFVDCGGLPDLDNTLFGHRAGSFTGAVRDLGGRLKAADTGVLVLDDFDRLNLHHQGQLHRVLVDGGYYQVGADRESRVSVRFIATTNRDPKREIEAGRLKEDFVSRLSYFELHVPSLHHRPGDLPELCEELLQRNLEDLRAKGFRSDAPLVFDEDCWPALQARTFDDNVRGLDKLIVRLIAHVDERPVITPEDIEAVSPAVRQSQGYWFDQPAPLRLVREEAEKRYILDVCRLTDWNLRRASRILGISPKSLYQKLRQYGIARPV